MIATVAYSVTYVSCRRLIVQTNLAAVVFVIYDTMRITEGAVKNWHASLVYLATSRTKS